MPVIVSPDATIETYDTWANPVMAALCFADYLQLVDVVYQPKRYIDSHAPILEGVNDADILAFAHERMARNIGKIAYNEEHFVEKYGVLWPRVIRDLSTNYLEGAIEPKGLVGRTLPNPMIRQWRRLVYANALKYAPDSPHTRVRLSHLMCGIPVSPYFEYIKAQATDAA